ncbi:MAG: hypothetical protein Q9222_004475 [Ikaeria aurantiellina]
MSHRFPPIPPSSLTPLQRTAEDECAKMFGADVPFRYKNEEGALIGPYGVLLYTPTLIPAWFALASAVTKQQPILSPREKELAVFATAFVYNSPAYILYAHRAIAARVGLSAAQIVKAESGEVPEGVSEEESVCYSTAYEIASSKGKLSEEGWEVAVRVLRGRERVAALTNLVAGYVYTSFLVNVGGIEAPE